MIHLEFLEDLENWCIKFRYPFYKSMKDLIYSQILMDYISVKILFKNKIAIISTQPAIELNLIKNDLYKKDHCYSKTFLEKDGFSLWKNAFSIDYYNDLLKQKMLLYKITSGISINKLYDNYSLNISFASKSNNKEIEKFYINNINFLKNFFPYINNLVIPMFEEIFGLSLCNNYNKIINKPFLKLISFNHRKSNEIT